MEAIILSFFWALYWPLFYVRLRGVFSRYDLTRMKLAACFVIAAASAAANIMFSIYSMAAAMAGIVILSAAMPVFILVMLEKAEKRRTHVKLLALAAYFHVFWQLLASFNTYQIIVDIAVSAGLILLAKIRWHRKGAETPRSPISELWK